MNTDFNASLENIGTSKSSFPLDTPIGMGYVPFQQWETPFPENTALENGTIFPSLFLPFERGHGA